MNRFLWAQKGKKTFNSPKVLLERRKNMEVGKNENSFNSPKVLLEHIIAIYYLILMFAFQFS